MNAMSAWREVDSPEGLTKALIAGIVIIIVVTVGTAVAAGVGNYILQVLNKTGFTIPAPANYVAPIESLPSLVFLIMRIAGFILIIVLIIEALLKRYGGL